MKKITIDASRIREEDVAGVVNKLIEVVGKGGDIVSVTHSSDYKVTEVSLGLCDSSDVVIEVRKPVRIVGS